MTGLQTKNKRYLKHPNVILSDMYCQKKLMGKEEMQMPKLINNKQVQEKLSKPQDTSKNVSKTWGRRDPKLEEKIRKSFTRS